MNQPRWQRRVVGAAAIVVGLVMCLPCVLLVVDLWQSRHLGLRIAGTDFILAGVCGTLGLTMIGIGLYDGFLSHTGSVDSKHNRFMKAAIWLAIATFGGFLILVLVNFCLQFSSDWR